MKRKIKHSDELIGKYKIVKDFLPTPEDLIFKDGNVKVIGSAKSRPGGLKRFLKDR